jgi:hypothetical protein
MNDNEEIFEYPLPLISPVAETVPLLPHVKKLEDAPVYASILKSTRLSSSPASSPLRRRSRHLHRNHPLEPIITNAPKSHSFITYWPIYLNIVLYSLALNLWVPILPFFLREINGTKEEVPNHAVYP